MKKKNLFKCLVAMGVLLGTTAAAYAQTVPVFSEDFEGSTTGWTFVNGSGTNANQWHVGSATNAVKSGSQAAYISYDGGTTYSYDVNSASRTHLYRDITFPTASPVTRPFMLTFDWKCMGETNSGGTTYYDYLSIFLSPNSFTPTAGGIFTGSSELNRWGKSSAWQQETVTLPGIDYSGVTKRLVLSWVNDGSGGANPPIAIDNIVIAPAVGVTFNSQGGSAVSLRYVASGAKVTAPSAPTRSGYIFDAWYIDAGYTTAWNFSTSLVTSDTTLYAKWDVRVDAEKPAIGTQPTGGAVTQGTTNTTLTVGASVSDGGTLTYQWYKPTTAVKTGGSTLSSAANAAYTTPANLALGSHYYYVVITNTNNGVNGTRTAKDTSDVVTVTVVQPIDAEKPNITTQPQNTATYDEGDVATALTVSAATPTDGGTLSYQWYSNGTNSTTGGTVLTGSTAASYTPSTATVGTAYYYVVVTNTNTGATGAQTAKDTSDVAVVIVNALVDAEKPAITTQPQDTATYDEGEAAAALTVLAAPLADGGTLSYQWYSNGTNSTTGGTVLTGSTAASYTPSTATVGTAYYYVVVTNTNTGATGAQTTKDTSNVAVVTVTAVPPAGTAPTITTTSLTAGTVGTAYSQTLTATGSTPITWSVTVGTLPAGLNLNASTGEISGTPTTAGAAVTFTVQAANGTSPDDTKVLSITINAAAPAGTAPTITTTSLPAGTVGTAYSQTLTATGSTPITWSVTVGTLPAGLNLNASTGEISGTPTTAGAAVTFTVQAANGTSPDDTKALSITINAASVAVTGVTLNKTSTSLVIGGTETLTPIVAPSNATNQNVSWSSSNTGVATVSAAGLVEAKAAGTAIITVTTTDGSKTATCTVTVTAAGTTIETIAGDKLQVHPNPTNGVVYVNNANGAEIKVHNLNGELLQTTRESRVDLSGYPNGVYLLRIGGQTLKVVKK
ncbi:bacterial Ig-like domain [Candidatus Symbiothrix dinenymphae]|nr:bacterial Ig-like domain [Candidatus Symbiothrix dinenymphae]